MTDWPQSALQPSMKEKVEQAKVLAVGAGGIGCELLKTLVLSGFKDIEVIDLDTIEVSNLNRQFLFRKQHVGHSKASVAAAAAQRLRPDISIIPHHANVKESKYDVDFFKRFDLVLNGLDNLDARRHVNRMALLARVPLVESGTAGYLGQVSVHVADKTECFDCQPKPAPKSYAVCTIRTSPDKPIHCVVWAKELLFPLLFGAADEESDLDPKGALKRGAEEPAVEYAKRVFRFAFGDKITEVLETAADDVWEGRTPPVALDLDALLVSAPIAKETSADGAASSACAAVGLADQNAVWTPAQSAAVFLEAMRRMLEHRADELGDLTFDKDDELAVEVVSAAANLRAACYHIPSQSMFDTKGMAGNIIHAIATTNAIISGLIVVEALKLIATTGDPAPCSATYLRQDLSNRKILTPAALVAPNPACAVCGTARLQVSLDVSATSLADFVAKVLRGHLGLTAPSLMFGSATSMFQYEEGDDLDPEEVEENAVHLPKALAELPGGGLVHNTLVEIRDQDQGDASIHMMVCHRAEWDEAAHPQRFEVVGELPVGWKEGKKEEESKGKVEEEDAGMAAAKRKRKAREDESGAVLLMDSDDEEDAGRAKRRKGGEGEGGDDDVIEVLD